MNSVLRKKCLRVENIDAALVTLADNMIETMYSASGLGLAANQVGVSSDLFVIDVGIEKEKRNPVIIINPVITASEEEILAEEGCLSIPGIRAEIKRHERIILRYQDLKQNIHEKHFTGITSRAIQHEMDHLNGKLFIDYLSPTKRLLIKKRLIEIESTGTLTSGIIL